MVLDFYCNYDFKISLDMTFLLKLPVSPSEFLELFYVTYGSFIPLSETDVLEHLKNKCNVDFNDKYESWDTPQTSFTFTTDFHCYADCICSFVYLLFYLTLGLTCLIPLYQEAKHPFRSCEVQSRSSLHPYELL